MNFKPNTLFTADNLAILRGMDSETIDLIYLDPPFNTGRTFAASEDSAAAGASFNDKWSVIDPQDVRDIEAQYPMLDHLFALCSRQSDHAYMVGMMVRLIEMHRVLKKTGSLYLHCDPKMSHYLKIGLDVVFGRGNFRNEIVWCYVGVSSGQKRMFHNLYDNILFYAKGDKNTFNTDAVRVPHLSSDKAVRRFEKGYKQNPLGKICGTWWADIHPMFNYPREYTGYPTQKPIKLLDRIIKASSNRGDIVLDPYHGSGTTLIAAERLQRQWIGIDESDHARDIATQRLHEERGLFANTLYHETEPPLRTDTL